MQMLDDVQDTSEIWEKVLKNLKDKIGEISLKTWITSIEGICFTSNACTLTAASEFHQCILEMRYFNLLKNTIDSVTGNDIALKIAAKPNVSGKAVQIKKDMPEPEIAFTNRLNMAYSFDNFVSGGCNRRALNAVRNFLDTSVQSPNPLILYGATGVGKTHLLQAIGNAYRGSGKSSRVLCIGINDYISELLKQIKQDNQLIIERSLEHLELLLVDDLHLLEDREGTQAEFISLLYRLMSGGMRVVLTTGRPLEKFMIGKISFLMESGSIVKLNRPDFQTKLRILKQYARIHEDTLSQDELEFIARTQYKGVRELIGAFNKAKLCRQLTAIL